MDSVIARRRQDVRSKINHARGRALALALALAGAVAIGGCDRPTLIPPSDKDLRRTKEQFAADAAKRNYPATAPRGGQLQAQADVDYGFANRIQVVNLSDEDWSNVELWVNETYVVFLPTWAKHEMKIITFGMLYDRDAHTFPTDNKETRIQKLEAFKDGKVYSVPLKLAE